MRKIVATTSSCKSCPNYSYYSGGAHVCSLVDEKILRGKEHEVAPFCPLPDYPSQIIAEMQTTIEGLRQERKYPLGFSILTHVGAKLGLNVQANGSGITIPFKDMGRDREVTLRLEMVTAVEPWRGVITFKHGDKTYKLHPEQDPPLLAESADEEGNLWSHHHLRAA